MSDTTDILETMRNELRNMELDHVMLAGRIMQQRRAIALVEEAMPRRPGRPRKVHDADADLPSIDDVRGILNLEPETAA